MASKERPEPLNEGVLKTIYEKFFSPLIYYKPTGMLIREWLEELFGTKYRDIDKYISVKSFKMPGLYCETANIKIQGVGFRDMTPGMQFLVRTDSRTPEEVDVEVLAGRGEKDNVFKLNSAEWESTKRYLFEAN